MAILKGDIAMGRWIMQKDNSTRKQVFVSDFIFSTILSFMILFIPFIFLEILMPSVKYFDYEKNNLCSSAKKLGLGMGFSIMMTIISFQFITGLICRLLIFKNVDVVYFVLIEILGILLLVIGIRLIVLFSIKFRRKLKSIKED